ncbi:hypothetical protein M1N59_00940 [Dehalococcoidales bacterium]|nr:hypothetical protein [Dehalococcoidales bacterium]
MPDEAETIVAKQMSQAQEALNLSLAAAASLLGFELTDLEKWERYLSTFSESATATSGSL